MILRIVGRVEVVHHGSHVLEHVRGPKLIAQTIGVGKQELSPVSVHRLDHIVVKPVHVEFREVEDAETHVSRLRPEDLRDLEQDLLKAVVDPTGVDTKLALNDEFLRLDPDPPQAGCPPVS